MVLRKYLLRRKKGLDKIIAVGMKSRNKQERTNRAQRQTAKRGWVEGAG